MNNKNVCVFLSATVVHSCVWSLKAPFQHIRHNRIANRLRDYGNIMLSVS